MSATGIMYLIEPVKDLEASTEILNNQLVCKKEIQSIIAAHFNDNGNFLAYNPQKMSTEIKKHPLIKDAFVRSTALPEKKFRIIVQEEKPWAFYRNKLYNQEQKVIQDYDALDMPKGFNSIDEVYTSILEQKQLNNSSTIAKIICNDDLDKKDLKDIKSLVDIINDRLRLINQNAITVVSIIDDETTLMSKDLKLMFGNRKQKYKNKLSKFESLLANIKDSVSEIKYIDLSLDTQEAIIGKKA